jgi:hypothetical protein
MHAGRISGEIADAAGATQESVMELAVGGSATGSRPGKEHGN